MEPNRSFISSYSLRSKNLAAINSEPPHESKKESDTETQSSTPNRDFLSPPSFQSRSKPHPKLKKIRSHNTFQLPFQKILTLNESDSSLSIRTSQNSDLVTSETENSLLETFMAFSLIKRLPEVDPILLSSISVNIPKKPGFEGRKTLIFDLDETLVHCVGSSGESSDINLKLNLPSGESALVGVNIRPYALDCLRTASEYFEVFVFTASHQSYADTVLDYLDRESLVYHRLYRNSCIEFEEIYIKDLRVLNRPLKDVVLVDNAIYSFGYEIDNGIPIKSWFSDRSDTELMKLTRYFHLIAEAHDVREINRETFKLYSFCEEVKTEELREPARLPQKRKSSYTPRTFSKRSEL